MEEEKLSREINTPKLIIKTFLLIYQTFPVLQWFVIYLNWMQRCKVTCHKFFWQNGIIVYTDIKNNNIFVLYVKSADWGTVLRYRFYYMSRFLLALIQAVLLAAFDFHSYLEILRRFRLLPRDISLLIAVKAEECLLDGYRIEFSTKCGDSPWRLGN